jgi:hypothetical protein
MSWRRIMSRMRETKMGDAHAGCGRPSQCGRDMTQEWEISASVLQVIWGDLFPRFVAQAWLLGDPDPFPVGLITPAQMKGFISAYMLNVNGGAGTPAGSAFEKRVTMVKDYLGTVPESKVMPMRYLGGGGFDFILSDAGLDLVAPPKPQNAPELLRYYQLRATGKSTIGLPDYLDGGDALAFDVQSPVGPSQVWASHLDIPVNASGSCKLKDLDCLSAVGDKETELFGFTLNSFTAAAAHVRCWQLEGSVYRGILEQLPRVVATVWRERLLACPAGPADPQSYDSRWRDMSEMRDIFSERLETSLPRPDVMVFEVGDELSDVMITNQGIRFPDVTKPPSLADMFKAISTGAAGNPVFTDSRRPPRF